MKLGSYTFEWDPDGFDLPLPERRSSFMKTYSSGVFFSWGVHLIGTKVALRWDWCPAEQFLRMREYHDSDLFTIWYPEQGDRLFLADQAGGDFKSGDLVQDTTTGIKATVSAAGGTQDGLSYITITGRDGAFVRGNTIERIWAPGEEPDPLPPTRSATVRFVDIMPNYNVEVVQADGEPFEVGTKFLFRRRVIVQILLLSEVT